MQFIIVSVLLAGVFLLSAEAGTSCRKFPIKTNPDSCCKFPKFKNDKAIIEECMIKYGSQAARLYADQSEGPVRGCCLAECFVNGTGHGDLNPDTLNGDALKAAEEQGIAAEWTPVMNAMTKKCSEEGTKRMDEFEEGFKLPPLDPSDPVCHPKYQFAMICSLKEMLADCPASLFTDTPECKELQEFAKTCDL